MIINDIQARKSVRTYDSQAALDFTELTKEIERVNQTTGPFGHKIHVSLVASTEDSSQMKLGTYGMIKGASNYLVVTIDSNDDCWLDLGFLFEDLILKATALGFGTVWMAGTFSRKHFKAAIDLKDNQLIPIVSPIGLASVRPSFVDKYVVKSKNHVRKDFNQLFYNSDLSPLELNPSNPIHNALEMVRLAPSAMNKQPWRVICEGNKYHFFNSLGFAKSKIDLGIAIYHFVSSLEAFEIEYQYLDQPSSQLDNYIVTIEINQ